MTALRPPLQTLFSLAVGPPATRKRKEKVKDKKVQIIIADNFPRTPDQVAVGARILLRGVHPSEKDPRQGCTHRRAVPITRQVLGHNDAFLNMFVVPLYSLPYFGLLDNVEVHHNSWHTGPREYLEGVSNFLQVAVPP